VRVIKSDFTLESPNLLIQSNELIGRNVLDLMQFYDSKDIFTMRKSILNYHLKSLHAFFSLMLRISRLLLQVHKT